ncbi:hypothetical protein WJX72_012242 [[Myrmecia] bisecta]|uniref:Peptidoglycan binding-like domain-containing protein n=1 Tax=[Myrmecia] bisecta TaxID=41462 RepID=A0AAW1PPH8_9CHLO
MQTSAFAGLWPCCAVSASGRPKSRATRASVVDDFAAEYTSRIQQLKGQGVRVYDFGMDHLHEGCDGKEVAALQDYLHEEGFFNAPQGSTGFYGAITTQSVKAWQTSQNIPPTGSFGNLSREVYLQQQETRMQKRFPGVSMSVPTIQSWVLRLPKPRGDQLLGAAMLLGLLYGIFYTALKTWRSKKDVREWRRLEKEIDAIRADEKRNVYRRRLKTLKPDDSTDSTGLTPPSQSGPNPTITPDQGAKRQFVEDLSDREEWASDYSRQVGKWGRTIDDDRLGKAGAPGGSILRPGLAPAGAAQAQQQQAQGPYTDKARYEDYRPTLGAAAYRNGGDSLPPNVRPNARSRISRYADESEAPSQPPYGTVSEPRGGSRGSRSARDSTPQQAASPKRRGLSAADPAAASDSESDSQAAPAEGTEGDLPDAPPVDDGSIIREQNSWSKSTDGGIPSFPAVFGSYKAPPAKK